MRHPDWEQRIWDLSCRVAEQMARNPAGILPQEDAKRCVAFAAWVASEFMDATTPKPAKLSAGDLSKLFSGMEADK